MQLYGCLASSITQSSAGLKGFEKQQDRFLWSRYSRVSQNGRPSKKLKVQDKQGDNKYLALCWEYHVLYITDVSTERKQRCREGEPGARLSSVDSVAVEVEGLTLVSR